MASSPFITNNNAWYSIQSFGTDYYLGAGSLSGSNATVIPATSSTPDSAQWQIEGPITDSQAYVVRSKSLPPSYCLGKDTSQLVLSACDRNASLWLLFPWNSVNGSDGWRFEHVADELQLYINPSTNELGARPLEGQEGGEQGAFQWAVSSLGAINDEVYSTVTFGMTSSTSATSATSTTSSTSTLTTAANTTSSATTSLTPNPTVLTSKTTSSKSGTPVTTIETTSTVHTSSSSSTALGSAQSSVTSRQGIAKLWRMLPTVFCVWIGLFGI